MKAPLLAGALALAAVLPFDPAMGEVVNFARAGAWTAYGGSARDGTKVCGVSARGGGKQFHLKYFAREQALTVQLFNTEWKATKGTKVDVRMTFDRFSPWTGVATSSIDSDGDTMLEFDIPLKQVDTWIEEFRASYRLVLGFPRAKVADWSIDLTGTNEISSKFLLCLKAMNS